MYPVLLAKVFKIQNVVISALVGHKKTIVISLVKVSGEDGLHGFLVDPRILSISWGSDTSAFLAPQHVFKFETPVSFKTFNHIARIHYYFQEMFLMHFRIHN